MGFAEFDKKHGITNNSKQIKGFEAFDKKHGITYNENINKTVAEQNLKNKIFENDIKRFSPFPQGTLTPSGMQSVAVKKLKDNKTPQALETTIPSRSYDADSTQNKHINVNERLGGKTLSETYILNIAKEKQKNNQLLTLSEKLALKSELVEPPKNEPYISKSSSGIYSNPKISRVQSKDKREKTFYYSSLPNGTVKSTNPEKKQYGLTFDDSIDWKYEYINDINGIRNTVKAQAVRGGSGKEYQIYDNLTDREIGIYNYLYENEGKNKANEFLEFIELDLDARLNQDAAETGKLLAEKSPVLSPVLSSVLSPIGTMVSAAEQVVNYGDFLVTGRMKTNKSSTAVSTIRNTVSEKVDWEID